MFLAHRQHRIARVLAAGLAAGALAAPTAVASPALERGSLSAEGAPTATVDPSSADAPVIVRAVDERFDWGSAAIGAGVAGAAVVLISLGGFAYVSRGRIDVAR
jgi:hypothetical protein